MQTYETIVKPFLHAVPTWVLFLITLLIVMATLWIGYTIGRKRQGKEDASSMGTIVTAVLGLFAFLLAFTFSITASRFEVRKQFLM